MRVHHIATAADWRAARRSGRYTTSTRGVSLEQEGFIHAARPEQVAGVFERYYADAGEPLVLLTIDTDRLEVPWREDAVGQETFPHLYGPLSPAAVVAVQPLGPDGATPSFTSLFVSEMGWRVGVAVLAMLLSGIAGTAAGALWGPAATLPGALAGLAVGAAVGYLLLTRVRWR